MDDAEELNRLAIEKHRRGGSPTRPSYEELVEALEQIADQAEDLYEGHIEGKRYGEAHNWKKIEEMARDPLSRIRTPEKGGSNG